MFNLYISLDTGYGFRDIKTIKNISLEVAIDICANSENYDIDVGNAEKENFIESLNFAITKIDV